MPCYDGKMKSHELREPKTAINLNVQRHDVTVTDTTSAALNQGKTSIHVQPQLTFTCNEHFRSADARV